VVGSAHALASASDAKNAAAAVGVYWFAFGGLTVLSLIVAAIFKQLLVWFIAVVVLTPVLQLAASLGACVFVLAAPLPDRRAAAVAVGKITLWSIAGTIGGGIVLAVLVGLFVLISR
jgi:hypothetical protein